MDKVIPKTQSNYKEEYRKRSRSFLPREILWRLNSSFGFKASKLWHRELKNRVFGLFKCMLRWGLLLRGEGKGKRKNCSSYEHYSGMIPSQDLCVCECSVMSDSTTPWAAGYQVPPSTEFSRQSILEWVAILEASVPGASYVLF